MTSSPSRLICFRLCFCPDSPGIPPSANTHQLFRGFSFVATNQGQEASMAPMAAGRPEKSSIDPIAEVNAAPQTLTDARSESTSQRHRPSRCRRQHLRGNFSDVYELKEEINQANGAVCKRCLHRVTAVEYSVKVGVTFTPALALSNFQQDFRSLHVHFLRSEGSAFVKASL